jgi:hypothetical protein
MQKVDLQEIERAVNGGGVPAASVASYARWWQLETYVREVVYTELRTKFGPDWPREVGEGARSRVEADQVNRYMASADAEDLLSYADAGRLFSVIEGHWDLFEPVLLPQIRWQGQIDTLRPIRHRIAHCRRPHSDDVSRIEQALRDLEGGARRFYLSYADTAHRLGDRKDPLVDAWVHRHHEAAARLIEHCELNYDTRFQLSYSVRPWAEEPEPEVEICGREGVIWHASWFIGSREVVPERLWKRLRPRTRELLLHLLIEEMALTATFAGMESAAEVADAIGDVFDTLIVTSRSYRFLGGMDAVDAEIEQMRGRVERLPPKVQYQSALSMFDPAEPEAFTLFAA